MENLSLREALVFKVGTAPQANFTAAVTNIITSAAHGLSEGDCVQLTTTTTLPAGLSLTTNYYVISVTTNTFKLSATPNGQEVDITDAGTGTHTFALQGKVVNAADANHAELGIFSANNANMTIQIQGSDQDDVNFNAAASATNRWSYLQSINLDTGAAVNGATGIVMTGTDFSRRYEININSVKYLCAQITSYTAGNVNLAITLFHK